MIGIKKPYQLTDSKEGNLWGIVKDAEAYLSLALESAKAGLYPITEGDLAMVELRGDE